MEPGRSIWLFRRWPIFKRGSLSEQLLIWLLPLILTITFAIYASTYLIARAALLRELAQGVQVVTQVAAAHVQAFSFQRHNDLGTISQSPLFRDYYMNVEYGLDQEAEVYRREIERMLLDFSRRAKTYPLLRYFDAGGREICRIRDDRILSSGSNRAAPEELRRLRSLRPGQRLSSGLSHVAWHPAPIVEYSEGIFDESGRQRGILVFDCSLGQIYKVLGHLRLGHSGRSYLVPRGALKKEEGRDTAGPVTASVAIAGTPWSVITAVDRDEFLEQLQWVSTFTLLLGIMAAVLLVAVVARRVQTLLEPLGALAEAANAYARGDLNARVDPARPGEVAALAEAFNIMADSLKQRTEDLEQRVRELTALQHMNEGVLRQLGRREIARLCLEAAVKGLGFERGALYWVDEQRGEAAGECSFTADSVGFDDGIIRRRRVEFASNEALARAVRGRQAVNVAGAESRTQDGSGLLLGRPAESFCLVPILGRERVLAVIAVDDSFPDRAVSAQRMRSLSIFGGAAGLALENSQLLDAIVRSEARYRTAVENSPDAVIGLDQAMCITLWNRRAEALFGYQPTEAYGRTLEFLFEEGLYPPLLRQVETKGSIRQAEAAGRARDGRRLDLSVSWTGQHGGYGASREWFVVIQDETEKKLLHSQLIQAEKMSAVGNLVAGVAHELNNPLAAVMGFAELLKDLPAKPEEREDLRLLHVSALRCRDIVQGLLLFARKGNPARHRVSLNRVVEATLSLCEYRLIKAEGIKLEVELDHASPQIAAEFQKVQQVLVNLINNACDALKECAGPRVVRLRTRSLEGSCEIDVEDTGPGIPAGRRSSLFEPFFTTKAPGKGTGLGLSISRGIVSEFEGSLRFEEPPQGGARFVMAFQRCPRSLPEADSISGLPPPVSGMKALLVDDEPDLVQLMRRILIEDGILPKAAVNGRDAIRQLRSGGFDLAITDIDMGSFKGTQLLEAAQGLAQPPAFVFVTGDVLNQELAQQLARLDVPVLAKPFLRTEFLRVVRRALQQRKLRDHGK